MINSKIISSIFLIFSGNVKVSTTSFGRLLSSQEVKAITGGNGDKNKEDGEDGAIKPEGESIPLPL